MVRIQAVSFTQTCFLYYSYIILHIYLLSFRTLIIPPRVKNITAKDLNTCRTKYSVTEIVPPKFKLYVTDWCVVTLV